MRYIAPIPILLGITGAILGILWLIAAGSEEDGGPQTEMLFVFGKLYVMLRVTKQLFYDPMSVLPAFGILVVSAGLIWLRIVML